MEEMTRSAHLVVCYSPDDVVSADALVDADDTGAGSPGRDVVVVHVAQEVLYVHHGNIGANHVRSALGVTSDIEHDTAESQTTDASQCDNRKMSTNLFTNTLFV